MKIGKVRSAKREELVIVLGRTVLMGLLMLVAVTSVILPAQALSKNPPPWKTVCYEVVGRDPAGVSHDVLLYHRWSATDLAAEWVSEGWTGVSVEVC
jgi:hypothetical protein